MNKQKQASPDHPIHDLIARRWSPYAFADRPVSDDDLRSLFEAARWAASSYNEQPWAYVVATKADPDAFARMLSCLVEGNQGWSTAAPVLALGCTSLTFTRNGKPNAAAVHDLGLASATLTFEATARGLVVHQMIGILPDKARDLFAAVRKAWPERLPLTARLSVTDWLEGGVTVEESVELLRRLRAAGLDLVDVSHGFVTPDISKVPWGPGFLIPVAGRIRREADIPTAVGWMISDPEQAEGAVRDGHADLVMLAREMLRDPYWPYHAALKLGDERVATILPVQYARAVKPR